MAKGHLKITVLNVLVRGPQNGYSLMKELEEILGRRPSPGSIYPILKDLSDQKLVTAKEEGKKKNYTITQKGNSAARDISKKKKEFIEQIKENMKMFECICGKENIKYDKEIINRLERTDLPFGALTEDLYNMRRTLVKLTSNRLSKEKEDKAIKIIEDTNSKLKKLIR